MNANNTSLSHVAGGMTLEDILSESGIKASEIIDQVAYNQNMKYNEFEDDIFDNFEYDGDAEDEVRFFDVYSNYDELLSNAIHDYDDFGDVDYADADIDGEDAFRDWTRGKFMYGQQYDGFKNMSKADQLRTRFYDKYLDQATLDKGITLSRRASAQLLGFEEFENPSLDKLQKMKGKVVLSRGNMSAGAGKRGLFIQSDIDDKPIEYKLHIPGNSKGAGMWVGDRRINNWGNKQREFMTNRDSLFVIGDTTTRKDVQKSWWWPDKKVTTKIVHLYWIGRLPHDYK